MTEIASPRSSHRLVGMDRRRLAILALLELLTAAGLVNCNRRAEDDRIDQICVAPAPTGERERRLDAGAEIYLHVYLAGPRDQCVSSSSFLRVPSTKSVGPTRWRVSGGFVDASPDRPRTPDCNGGLTTTILGKLAAGSYDVESTLGLLRFEIPSPETRVCLSRSSSSGSGHPNQSRKAAMERRKEPEP